MAESTTPGGTTVAGLPTPEEATDPAVYTPLRQAIGSQVAYGEAVDRSDMAISRRERGESPISREAAMALLYLHLTREL